MGAPRAERAGLQDHQRHAARQQPGALSLKVEGAEITYGTVSEKREQYTIATYARGLAVTREMIVNDDLRAFDRAITGFAGSARRLENSLVYQQLTANGNMSDAWRCSTPRTAT